MQQIIKFVLSLVLLGTLSCHSQNEKIIERVDKATIHADVIGKNVQLIDVRTPREFNDGYIDGARNFDLSQQKAFLEQINTLAKDQPVYLYCTVGGRSGYAAKILKKEGFTKIYDYSGGYNDWVRN
ncbi:MAG: rhodanese-like domain-containing protein [Algicola sp.]|nr:rhodanese-like domain-containing protein [Algicola sp.]